MGRRMSGADLAALEPEAAPSKRVSGADLAKMEAAPAVEEPSVLDRISRYLLEKTGPGVSDEQTGRTVSGKLASRGVGWTSGVMPFADEVAGAGGAAVELGKGALGLAGMDGAQPLAAYRSTRGDFRQTQHAAKEYDPAGYGEGEIIGAVMQPGPTGKAGIAKTLGRAAIVGGANALGSSEADLTNGDFWGALTDTGTGALLSAAPTALLHGGGKLIAGAPAWLKDLAERSVLRGMKSTNVQKRALDKVGMLREMPRDLLDSGLVPFGGTATNLADNVSREIKPRGDFLSGSIAAIDDKAGGMTVDPRGVSAKIRGDVVEPAMSALNTESRAAGASARKQSNLWDIQAGGQTGATPAGDMMSLAASEREKSLLGSNVKKMLAAKEPSAKQTAMADVYTAVKGANEDAARAVDPDLADVFGIAKKRYGTAAAANSILKDRRSATSMADMLEDSGDYGVAEAMESVGQMAHGDAAGGGWDLVKNFVTNQMLDRGHLSTAVGADMSSKALQSIGAPAFGRGIQAVGAQGGKAPGFIDALMPAPSKKEKEQHFVKGSGGK